MLMEYYSGIYYVQARLAQATYRRLHTMYLTLGRRHVPLQVPRYLGSH